jgi:hypothetical protein
VLVFNVENNLLQMLFEPIFRHWVVQEVAHKNTAALLQCVKENGVLVRSYRTAIISCPLVTSYLTK